jgi:hypothetical protein
MPLHPFSRLLDSFTGAAAFGLGAALLEGCSQQSAQTGVEKMRGHRTHIDGCESVAGDTQKCTIAVVGDTGCAWVVRCRRTDTHVYA